MYIDSIEIRNFRNFRRTEATFVHPDQDFQSMGIRPPRLNNINLVLGDNGLGKTSMLKAIALACLGPAVGRSGIYPFRLIRREAGSGTTSKRVREPTKAEISARFTPHPQDRTGEVEKVESAIEIKRQGDLESAEWTHPDEKRWFPIYREESDAFFFVGYGTARRIQAEDRFNESERRGRSFARAQRVQSLFEETYSLIPLNNWLPRFHRDNPGRYKQVINLVNDLMGEGHYRFGGRLEKGEYLFDRKGLLLPFRALSDGYRAFLGWVGDLLYHVCITCPKGKKLVDNKGIVLVDEIDLHLHPRWQMEVLPILAAALPNIQFIVTTHSPLIVSSLEWMNILLMRPSEGNASVAERVEFAVHGLDADQVLLTEFFGLQTTRGSEKVGALKELTLRAREGDKQAAKELLSRMSSGEEASQ